VRGQGWRHLTLHRTLLGEVVSERREGAGGEGGGGTLDCELTVNSQYCVSEGAGGRRQLWIVNSQCFVFNVAGRLTMTLHQETSNQ
jgi:hypothetical protein